MVEKLIQVRKELDISSEKEKMSLIDRIVVEIKALRETSDEIQSSFNDNVIESLEKTINLSHENVDAISPGDTEKLSQLVQDLKAINTKQPQQKNQESP